MRFPSFSILSCLSIVCLFPKPSWGQWTIPNGGPVLQEGIVTFWLDPSLSQTVRDATLDAISTWDTMMSNHTFVQRSTSITAWLKFQRNNSGITGGCGGSKPCSVLGTGEIISALVRFPTASDSFHADQARKTASHELGHLFGLDHPVGAGCTEADTVMQPSASCTRTTFPPGFLDLPGSTDVSRAQSATSRVASNRSYHDQAEWDCASDYGEWDEFTCDCDYDARDDFPGPGSPILISLSDRRVDLTNAADGVGFDLNGDGTKEHISWTAGGSDDAFLALDRNFDGKIQTGKELFGNFTFQPPSDERNGFLALSIFDEERWGGNRDGVISEKDRVFDFLRLWLDDNHDGISQPTELLRLKESGLKVLKFKYRKTGREDDSGNAFRYVSFVRMDDGSKRLAVDVFFVD